MLRSVLYLFCSDAAGAGAADAIEAALDRAASWARRAGAVELMPYADARMRVEHGRPGEKKPCQAASQA